MRKLPFLTKLTQIQIQNLCSREILCGSSNVCKGDDRVWQPSSQTSCNFKNASFSQSRRLQTFWFWKMPPDFQEWSLVIAIETAILIAKHAYLKLTQLPLPFPDALPSLSLSKYTQRFGKDKFYIVEVIAMLPSLPPPNCFLNQESDGIRWNL